MNRSLTLVAAAAFAITAGAAAVAAAGRPVFIERETEQLDATVDEGSPLVLNEEPGFRRVTTSPSLEAMERAGLPPDEWPWFSDQVSAPEDAISGAPELVGVISEVAPINGLRILSSERVTLPGEPDLGWQFAWLKLNDHEVLRIATQMLTSELVIPADARDTVVSVYGGQAAHYTKPGAVITRLVVGDRIVLVDLHLVSRDGELSLTADDLLKIAARVMDGFGS